MIAWRIFALAIITLYTPILLFTTSLVARKSGARQSFQQSAVSLGWSLFLLWSFAALAAASLALDGRLSEYGKYLAGHPRPGSSALSLPMGILLGAVTGAGLYLTDAKLFPPIFQWLFHRKPHLRTVLREQPPHKALSVLKLYTSPWIIPLTFVTSFAEEFLWRVFYITEMHNLVPWLALGIILSSTVYGSYHFSRGARDTFVHGFNGVALATLFAFTGVIWAPYTAHLVFNLISINRLGAVLKLVERQQAGRHISQNPY